jgi:hypothetical protein
MPRFHLDVPDTAFRSLDEGSESLETIETAHAAALDILSDIIQEEVPARGRELVIHIREGQGNSTVLVQSIRLLVTTDGWELLEHDYTGCANLLGETRGRPLTAKVIRDQKRSVRCKPDHNIWETPAPGNTLDEKSCGTVR